MPKAFHVPPHAIGVCLVCDARRHALRESSLAARDRHSWLNSPHAYLRGSRLCVCGRPRSHKLHAAR